MTKDDDINFLRERSRKSLDGWFEGAERLAMRLDEDMPKKDFEEICWQGWGITYTTATVYARIVRDEVVQAYRGKIVTNAWTTFRPIPRFKLKDRTKFREKMDKLKEPIPMTEKEVLALRVPPKKRAPRKTSKSPFMDKLDFDARVARFERQLGDDRKMKANPRYQKHFDRLDEAKTLVGSLVDPIFEELLLILSRAITREFLTMANGMLIHNNDLERDLHLAPTTYSEPEIAAVQPDPKPPEDSEDEKVRRMFEQHVREDEEPTTAQPQTSRAATTVLPALDPGDSERGRKR